jgi:hypothetical protein
MATLPTFVTRSEVRSSAQTREDRASSQVRGKLRIEPDPFLLRPLPGEDIFFFTKRIDNARVVRQPDPRSRGAAWSAAGVMCLLAALLTGSIAPRMANLFAGYRVEALRQEQQRLIDETMVLDVEQAKLLRLDRLHDLARRRNLFPPKAGQTFDLEPKGDGSMAVLTPRGR